MMKSAFIALVAMVAPASAWAQGFAVVDTQYVISESDAAKKALQDLESIRKKSQAQIDKMEQEIAHSREELMRKKAVLSEQEFLEEEARFRQEWRNSRAKVQSLHHEQ